MPPVAPPVFVGGLNRSGTTLMARILGSGSALAFAPSEFLFFGRGAGVEPADRPDFERRLGEILGWPRVLEWGLDEHRVLASSRTWPACARSLFLLPLEAYRARLGKERVGEKSVLNEFRISTFREWLGDFRLVHMVRDPLATYASGHQHAPPDLRRAVRWARLWRESARLGLRGRRDDPARYRLVRYEDLTAQPAATVAGIAEFLGIPFEEQAMLGLQGAVVDPRERAATAAVCGRIAERLGYIVDDDRRHGVAVAAAHVAEDARPRHRLRTIAARFS